MRGELCLQWLQVHVLMGSFSPSVLGRCFSSVSLPTESCSPHHSPYCSGAGCRARAGEINTLCLSPELAAAPSPLPWAQAGSVPVSLLLRKGLKCRSRGSLLLDIQSSDSSKGSHSRQTPQEGCCRAQQCYCPQSALVPAWLQRFSSRLLVPPLGRGRDVSHIINCTD